MLVLTALFMSFGVKINKVKQFYTHRHMIMLSHPLETTLELISFKISVLNVTRLFAIFIIPVISEPLLKQPCRSYHFKSSWTWFSTPGKCMGVCYPCTARLTARRAGLADKRSTGRQQFLHLYSS